MADIDSEKERRLVADLLEGDESAFCELYALYKDRLMWFLRRTFTHSPLDRGG